MILKKPEMQIPFVELKQSNSQPKENYSATILTSSQGLLIFPVQPQQSLITAHFSDI